MYEHANHPPPPPPPKDRTTAIGKAIDEYLNNKVELEDHAIHLLFSANRWESRYDPHVRLRPMCKMNNYICIKGFLSSLS